MGLTLLLAPSESSSETHANGCGAKVASAGREPSCHDGIVKGGHRPVKWWYHYANHESCSEPTTPHGEEMRVFDRELDELEETIVYLALVFLVSTAIVALVGRFVGIVGLIAGLASSLSLVAGLVSILLWLFRSAASPLYVRLHGPETNSIQGIFPRRNEPASGNPQGSSDKTR